MGERMTPADHVLASAIGALVTRRIYNKDRETMLVGVVRSVLPDANRNNPHLERLIELAYSVEQCFDDGARAGWMLDASEAYARFSEWRLGLAQDAWRNGVGEA